VELDNRKRFARIFRLCQPCVRVLFRFKVNFILFPYLKPPMVHCADFYEKWKKNPNWCNKCPSSVFTIEKYLEMIKKLDDAGIPEGIAYAKITENQVRKIPKKRMDLYIPEIAELMKGNIITKKITDKQLRNIITGKLNLILCDDYDYRYESPPRPPRKIVKHKVKCPKCDWEFEFFPEKRKKIQSNSTLRKTEEEKHERRKERIRRALSKYGVEWDVFDRNAEYDSTLDYKENLALIKKKIRIPTELPSVDQIDQMREEFEYKRNLNKGEGDEKEPALSPNWMNE